MKQVAALSLAFLLAGCLPALQEEQITVSAEGKIEVEPDSVRQSVFFRSREASSDEKAALWPLCDEMYADFALYRARTNRDIPIFICE